MKSIYSLALMVTAGLHGVLGVVNNMTIEITAASTNQAGGGRRLVRASEPADRSSTAN